MIYEQRVYINYCTQIKIILTGLPMYAYWPGRVFVYVVHVCSACMGATRAVSSLRI